MANPRKFSEKIALHTHRQAEETARFEQIMREVSDATARVHSEKSSSSSKNTLRINSQTTTPTASLGSFRGGSLPNVSAQNAKGPSQDGVKPEEVSHSPVNVQYRESRIRSQGGPIRRPQDRKHDTSPYSGGSSFLSPPDTSWRRTNSDSALHQSAMQSNERNDNSSNRWIQTMNGPEQHDNRPRPRSSCEVPRVPGINVYHTAHDPSTIQIPIGNNTGSLPDLTSVHFPSPIHVPLDQDADQESSPYSSSPVNTSPSTLSPTSLQAGVRQHGGTFHFNMHQNHLSVPVNSSYLHHNKGVAVEKNVPLENQDYTQLRGMSGIYQQQVPPTSPSPTLQQVAPGYRSPRPSPQSSPSLGGRHSAPCSPGVPPSPLSPLTNEYQIYSQHQASQLQQHFEQFSMMDPPVSVQSSYIDQSQVSGGGGVQYGQTQPLPLPEVSAESTGDAGYYSTSPSQFVYHTAPASLHTTPNTPTSIPDIILTDFSSADDTTKLSEVDFLRGEGLGPLDLEGLQMLSDSSMNLIEDGVEEVFRLEHS